jgi:hypothetical protein
VDGSDEVNEGVWLQWNGEPMTYFNWMTGEPNSESGNEDCNSLRKEAGYKRNDASCLFKFKFICQV